MSDSSFSEIDEETQNKTIPSELTLDSVPMCRFSGNSTIKCVNILSEAESIGMGAFKECYNLKKANIAGGVKIIKGQAFKECDSLEEVIIEEGVTTIEFGAFIDCHNLKKLSLPDSIKYIGDMAFFGCDGLCDENGMFIFKNILFYYRDKSRNHSKKNGEIIIPDGITHIANGTFDYFGLASLFNSKNWTVTIPESVQYIGQRTFQFKNVTIIAPQGSYAEKYAKKHQIKYCANGKAANKNQNKGTHSIHIDIPANIKKTLLDFKSLLDF